MNTMNMSKIKENREIGSTVDYYFVIDRLKPILKLRENPPHPPTPPGTNFFSAISCRIFIKLCGYLPNHLATWSVMSKMTTSFKYPVRNPQCPPRPKFRPDPNHVRFPSNFQDISLIIYWHDSKSPVSNL